MEERLLVDMPNRTYVLMGDSAMKDPEYESAVMRKYPRQVKMITIRKSPAVKWFRNR